MIETTGLIARFVTYCAILCIVGAVAFRLLIVTRSGLSAGIIQRGSRRAAAIGSAAGMLVIVAALVKLVLQTAEMRFPGDSWIGVGSRMLFETSWGTTWLVQVACALLITMTFTLARKDALPRWNVLALLSIALASTPAFASHAKSAQRLGQYTVFADAAHVFGASLWLGTLFVMFMSIVRGDGNEPQSELSTSEMRAMYIASLLRSFSPVALIGAALVVASGVLASFAHITHWNELTGTRYGQNLLAKLAAVGLVWLFGWRNWKFITPYVSTQGPRRMTRSMAIELTLTLVVIVLTAALVVTPPPAEAMLH